MKQSQPAPNFPQPSSVSPSPSRRGGPGGEVNNAIIKLNPWQIHFLQSKARIKAAICGRGSGKTNTLNHVIAQSARALPGAKASLNCITFGQALEIILEQSEGI